MKLLVSLGLFTHFRMLVLVARFDFCDCFFHVLGWMSEEGSILACPSLIPFFPQQSPLYIFLHGHSSVISFDLVHP